MNKLVHYRVNHLNRICGVRRMDRVYLHNSRSKARGSETAKKVYRSATDHLRTSPYLKVDRSGGTVSQEVSERNESWVGKKRGDNCGVVRPNRLKVSSKLRERAALNSPPQRWILTLLDRVGQLMGQQPLSIAGFRRITSRTEDDVVTHSECGCVHRSRSRGGLVAGMHTHMAKILTKTRLKKCANRLRQRPAKPFPVQIRLNAARLYTGRRSRHHPRHGTIADRAT